MTFGKGQLIEAVTAMQKPLQRMMLQELRDELDRTRPAWDAANLDGVLACGHPPALGERVSVTSWSRKSCCRTRATADLHRA
jgi:hypothetical protein